MKMNIFKINLESLDGFKNKLLDVNMSSVFTKNMNGWKTELFFSKEPEDIEIPWLNYFKEDINNESYRNKMYYGAFIWTNLEDCFVITYGKSHHYAKPFCETGFGLNLAMRIADQNDIRQKSVKKFGGKNTRSINSYQRKTFLDLSVNESVDYLNAKITDDKVKFFAKQAKFGDSFQITKDISWGGFSELLNSVVKCLQQDVKFNLPKVTEIKDTDTVDILFNELKSALLMEDKHVDVAESTYSIVGVDFNFNTPDKYELYFSKGLQKESQDVNYLDLSTVIQFANDNNADVFDVKIKFITDNRPSHSKDLKNIIDYTHPDKKIILQDGKWYQLNEEFMNQLNEFIDKISMVVDSEYPEIDKCSEDYFNKLLSEKNQFELFDKKFSYVGGHKLEAWDLKKNKCVYAVKFGAPQHLSYVFDQAMNTIRLLTNKVSTDIAEGKLNFEKIEFDTYCIWLGLDRATKINKLSDVESLIFKQKAVEWHRVCQNLDKKSKIIVSYIKKN